MNRVAVTGIGLVTCAGNGKTPFLLAVREGRSGISKVTRFVASIYRSAYAGEVKGIKGGDRAYQMVLAAVKEALEEADVNSKDLNRIVIIGTAHGDLENWQKFYSDILEGQPPASADFLPSSLSEKLGQEFGWRTHGEVISTACTSSTLALGKAFQMIKHGRADFAVVGGVDVLTEFIFAGFDSLRALTPTVCRPFDKDRDGLILGEGAGCMVLENFDSAIKRGAKIYAELAGFGAFSDAYHLTAPDPRGNGAALSLEAALKEAGIGGSEVSYVNAHGTGTRYNDRMECAALKKVLKEDVFRIPVSSIKPIIGHTSGAAGAIEAALCCLCIQEGLIPLTLNFQNPDPDYAFDFVPHESRQENVKVAVTMNSAFGGNNACLVFKRAQ